MSLVSIYILLLGIMSQVSFSTAFIFDISDILIETVILTDRHAAKS